MTFSIIVVGVLAIIGILAIRAGVISRESEIRIRALLVVVGVLLMLPSVFLALTFLYVWWCEPRGECI